MLKKDINLVQVIYLPLSSFSSLHFLCYIILPRTGLARNWKTLSAPGNGLMSPAAVSQQERSAADSLTELWSKVEDRADRWLGDERGAAAAR